MVALARRMALCFVDSVEQRLETRRLINRVRTTEVRAQKIKIVLRQQSKGNYPVRCHFKLLGTREGLDQRPLLLGGANRFASKAPRLPCRTTSDIRSEGDRTQKKDAPKGAFEGLVEPRGIEPLTSAMPLQRSPS